MSDTIEGRTTITFKQEFTTGDEYTTTISINDDCLDIHTIMQDLVKPVLLGAGFHYDLVNQYIGEI